MYCVQTGCSEPQVFEPWNSGSSGYQTAENQVGHSIHWRDLRDAKLGLQFSGSDRRLDGLRGVHRKDEVRDHDVAGTSKGKRQVSILDSMGGRMKKHASKEPPTGVGKSKETGLGSTIKLPPKSNSEHQHPQIFSSLKIYINGSTYPTISDHKLKQLLVQHGANLTMGLARRSVTHVILGRPSRERGCGGGLAATKIEHDMKRSRGVGLVKFVTVEWVIESLKAGKRLPEARFAGLKEEVKAQGGVYGIFAKKQAG
ncbi:hypothetical protein P152DRAFT_492398 [Eremomyces bilateralis CBS 781.70]|uniref:BRCT domain-containing protein n=1 Tax=Eremomyces bilateralis CBS 781.70 TaxID=1392243 RepID=A0A6G1GEE8_9PEZI|nr:uncharacterized protein P152DRAFT_492398 [Eremomyces bilateralis CBS 781.70]KAF1816286.1 hypothetical protein P152DRAFT_492398 [Eremomyces bilateralis CBS 781.70]